MGASQRRPGSAAAPKRTQISRPVSAPSLLRGEGMLKHRTHEDPFLQGIENQQVNGCLGRLKGERFFIKDSMKQVDMLADPSLHDLLLMHNGSQRSRCESAGRRRNNKARAAPRSDGRKMGHIDSACCLKSAASSQVRELSAKLKDSIQHSCESMDVPEELGLHKVPQRFSMTTEKTLQGLGGLFRCTKQQPIDGAFD